MKDYSVSVDRARYASYVVENYLDTTTLRESTSSYYTTLPSNMIFTKADVSTSDGKNE